VSAVGSASRAARCLLFNIICARPRSFLLTYISNRARSARVSACVCSSNYYIECMHASRARPPLTHRVLRRLHTDLTSSSPDRSDAGNFNLSCPRLMCSVVLIIHRFEFTGTTPILAQLANRDRSKLFTHRCLYIYISS
jgi:hypothetical protein